MARPDMDGQTRTHDKDMDGYCAAPHQRPSATKQNAHAGVAQRTGRGGSRAG